MLAEEMTVNARFARLIAVIAAFACASTLHVSAADSPQRIYARSWEGKTVVVKRVLYTLVYNERGRLGNSHNSRRDGLTVLDSSRRVVYQFDGRQGRDAVVAYEPQKMFDAVDVAYQPDTLDVRAYRKVEPVVIHRYSPGVELIVSRIRIDRDVVRVELVQTTRADPDEDPATWLTIKWPVPFNKSFSERDLVDDLIRLFVDVKPGS
jgi:hypothetical protein